jgi:pilus assembly protein CpaE
MIDSECIWLLTKDPATTQMVQTALRSEERIMVRQVDGLPDLANHLKGDPLCLVLVDLDPSPVQMLVQLEPIISRFDRTRFVVLSKDFDQNLVLEAMQIGARQFVVKQSITPELPRVVKRLTPNGSSRDLSVGHTICVMSAGGGCGATTLAVNLANELQHLSRQSVLLVDLDVFHGTIALCLGLDGTYGIGDILAHEGRIDPQLIRSTALRFTDTLHALLSPASTVSDRSATLNFARLAGVVQAWNEAYPWTVVDAPRLPIDAAAELAVLSRCTFIVGQLLVKDVRTSRDVRNALMTRGVRGDAIRPIASRYSKRTPLIEVSDAERAIGAPLQVISNDFPSASGGINIGRPLSDTAPHSVLRHDIERLAQKLSDEMAPKKPALSTGA